MKSVAAAIVGMLAATAIAAVAAEPSWDPEAFAKEDTLELLTVGPEEGE